MVLSVVSSGRRVPGERGSVTAELALAMPSVALVIAVTLSAFGLQIERMKLVSLSATVARALGRGEDAEVAADLVAQADPLARVKVDYLTDFVCSTVIRNFRIASLPPIEVSERQCARKSGL